MFLFVLPSSIYANNSLNDFKFDIDSLRFITTDKNNLILIFDSSVTYLNQNNLKVETIKKIDGQFDKKLMFSNFEIVKNSIGDFFFVRKELGEVFNFKNNSFSRLDKSTHSKIAKGSFKIFHNGHLLSFFGRDEYHASNFVLDFNLNSKVWNKIIPSNNSEIPTPRINSYFKKINDTVHYFGGKSINNKNLVETFLSDYYIYNLTDKKHEKVGELLNKDFRKATNGSVIDINNYSSLFFNQKEISLIDFKNLNSESKSINSVLGVNERQFYSSNVVKFKNKIYYFNDKNLTGLVNLESIEISKIIDQFNDPSTLLLNKKNDIAFNNKLKFILLFLFPLIIALIISVRLFKLKNYKKQNVLKQSNYLTYDNVILTLSFEESCIMDFLIENLKVKLADIFELDCFVEYSDTYKKIYIPKLLKTLDDKFKILNKKDNNFLSLVKTKNKFDKRILEFYLKGQISPYNGWIRYIFNIY